MSFLTKPAIQAYFAPGSVALGPTAYIDRMKGNIVGIYNAERSLTLLDIFSGTVVTDQDVDDLGVDIAEQFAIISAPDGSVWCYGSNQICRVDPTTTPWTVTNRWGSGSGIPSNIPGPYSMAWLQIGNGGWLVTGGVSGGTVDVVQGLPGAIGFFGHDFAASVLEDVAITPGPQGPMNGTAFWIGAEGTFGKSVIQSSAALYDPLTWPAPNSGIASTTIGTYGPTDFDADWTAFRLWGPAYDSTDGNAIVQAARFTGTGNAAYIAKLSAADGTILWKVPINDPGASFGGGVQSSRIQNGVYLYYANDSTFGGTVYAIRTADGSFTTKATTGLLSILSPASDDVIGGIIGQANWDSGSGNLLLLNATPASGNTLSTVYFISSENPQHLGGAIGYTRMFGTW